MLETFTGSFCRENPQLDSSISDVVIVTDTLDVTGGDEVRAVLNALRDKLSEHGFGKISYAKFNHKEVKQLNDCCAGHNERVLQYFLSRIKYPFDYSVFERFAYVKGSDRGLCDIIRREWRNPEELKRVLVEHFGMAARLPSNMNVLTEGCIAKRVAGENPASHIIFALFNLDIVSPNIEERQGFRHDFIARGMKEFGNSYLFKQDLKGKYHFDFTGDGLPEIQTKGSFVVSIPVGVLGDYGSSYQATHAKRELDHQLGHVVLGLRGHKGVCFFGMPRDCTMMESRTKTELLAQISSGYKRMNLCDDCERGF